MSERRKILEKYEANKAEIDKKISEGIEKYRKGDLKITLKDADGKEISGAKVELVQKSHEFRFGANIFMLDELETPEKNETYKKTFAELFNMATLPFYWNALEPERNKPRYAKDSRKIYRRPAPDLCIEFCEQNGIEPREHALAYDAFFPAWLRGKSVEETKREIERRFSEIAERYADKIPTIEVTNEMEWGDGVTSFYDEPDFIEWCFKTAEKYFPNNKLGINEWMGLCWEDHCRATDKYYAYIEANMLKGARIDAIGMQYHLFFQKEDEYRSTRRLLDPSELYRHMDLYSNFGKPLQITEVTVPSYSWEDEDEQIQADVIEMLYSIWFSHPSVEQIIYWNVVDGYAHVWNPDPEKIKASQGNMTLGENYYHGGLLRFDMTPKPAYYRIKELFYKRWHTEESLVSDENGCISARGFYGDYELTVSIDGKVYKKEIAWGSGADNEFTLEI